MAKKTRINQELIAQAGCHSCDNFHGHSYNGNYLNCATHPFEPPGEDCPDWEGNKKPNGHIDFAERFLQVWEGFLPQFIPKRNKKRIVELVDENLFDIVLSFLQFNLVFSLLNQSLNLLIIQIVIIIFFLIIFSVLWIYLLAELHRSFWEAKKQERQRWINYIPENFLIKTVTFLVFSVLAVTLFFRINDCEETNDN